MDRLRLGAYCIRSVFSGGAAMQLSRFRSAALFTALAMCSLAVTPSFARDRGHHHHHRRGGGIDAGDILAGALIIGGVAVIADAITKSSDRPDRYDDDYRPRYPGGPVGDVDRGSYRGAYRAAEAEYGSGVGYGRAAGNRESFSFDQAVDICVEEVEAGGDYADRRVGSVDSVRKMGDRIAVAGALEDGRGFACSVDGGGQVRSAAIDGRAIL